MSYCFKKVESLDHVRYKRKCRMTVCTAYEECCWAINDRLVGVK
jgi:hypothetical protein